MKGKRLPKLSGKSNRGMWVRKPAYPFLIFRKFNFESEAETMSILYMVIYKLAGKR